MTEAREGNIIGPVSGVSNGASPSQENWATSLVDPEGRVEGHSELFSGFRIHEICLTEFQICWDPRPI